MSICLPEKMMLSIEAHQFGTSQWTETVLQTEVKAAGRDVGSSHHDGDMLAIIAAQCSARGRCWQHCGIFLAWMRLDPILAAIARAVNSAIQAASTTSMLRLVFLASWSQEI
jgi:hypothetical protein